MTRCSVLIIGAGVNGLGTAYELMRQGVDDVVVLEQRYPMYGGSGRNAGGVRAQWGSLANLELAREALPRWPRMAGELGIHTWFRQDGYLMLVRDEAARQALRERARFQRALGVPTQVMTPDEAKEIAPAVDVSSFVGASYCPEDAVIFPWPVVNGLREAVTAGGLTLRTNTAVTGIQVDGGRVTEVRAGDDRYRPDVVVNAAGPWSHKVAALAGLELPNRPVRHQIFVTEALKPMLDPMVVDLSTGLYVSQDGRGELVSGLGDRQPLEEVTTRTSRDFLPRVARQLVELVPSLAGVNAMRQWAGCYDVTPDHIPNLGPHPQAENFLQLNGFSGHGFMISPAVTRVTARLVLGRDPGLPMERYAVDRFDRGTTEPESMVIG